MPPNGAVPVEALLKLSLDKAGAQSIQDFLDKQETSFSRIEQYAGKISGHFEGIARGALGLAGIAGLGAVLNQFLGVSQQGALVGLAAGNVTGGANVWHSYAQGLLGAQAQTGVSSGQIAEGLVMAVQAVGGSPTPQQAAVLGGLLAGYGNTVGLSPSQVAAVITPILQASNKPLTTGNLLGTAATLTQGLSAFPGSQAAPMLGLLSQLGLSQALGIGPAGGFTPDMHGLVATVNSLAQVNGIWRNPQVAGSAISGVSGGLQNAYGNPAMEAFLQMAGVGYYDQRKGFTPQNARAIIGEATRLYGTGVTRDLALRSMFGLTGADLLEQISPGSKGAALLNRDLQLGVHPDQQQLLHQIHNAQLSHTPQADINKLTAQALRWLFASPLHALLGLGGAGAAFKLGGSALRLLGKGLARGGGAAWGALRGGGDVAPGPVDPYGTNTGDGWFSNGAGAGETGAGTDAFGGALRGILGDIAGGLGTGLLGAGASALIFPGTAGGAGDALSTRQAEQIAVHNVLRMGLARFGAKGIRSPAAQAWMRNMLSAANNVGPGATGLAGQVWGMGVIDASGGRPIPLSVTQGALGMLNQALGGGSGIRTANGKDPIDAFTQGAQDLEKAAQGLLQFLQGPKSGFTSYNPGGGMGTPAIQAMGATAPGLEYASLVTGGVQGAVFAALSGTPTPSGGGGGTPVSYTPGGSPSTSGGGWQTAVASYYNPGQGGINGSYGGGAWAGHPVEPSTWGFAHKTMAFGTRVQFLYKGKSTIATCVDRGPFVAGRDFDLLPGPAGAIGMTSAGVVTLQWRLAGASASPDSGSGGGSGSTAGAGHTGLGVNGGPGGGSGSGSGGGTGTGTWDGPMQAAAAGDPYSAARHAHHAHVAQTIRPEQHHHHVKVYVDNRQARVHRILTGHYRA